MFERNAPQDFHGNRLGFATNKEESILFSLPDEILILILSSLNIEQFFLISLVNLKLYRLVFHSNDLWRPKFQAYFPQRYYLFSRKENVNLPSEFKIQFRDQYNHLSPSKRKAIHWTIEGDINAPIQLNYVDLSDKIMINLARRDANQKMLDYFYGIIKDFYKDKMVDFFNNHIVLWKIRCLQSPETILTEAKARSFKSKKVVDEAIEVGYLELVKMAISKDASLLAQTFLFKAIEIGNEDIIIFLLEQEIHIDIESYQNINMLYHSIKSQCNLSQHLLDRLYAIIKKKFIDENGQLKAIKTHIISSILFWAIVLRQNQNEITLLLSEGSSLEERYGCCEHPVHVAVQVRHTDIFASILTSNVNSLEAQDVYQQTPLILAAKNGCFDLVAVLLDKKANVFAKTKNYADKAKDGKTALHWAAETGEITIAELLIREGADIYAENGMKELPIHFAAKNGHVNILRLFIEQDRELINKKNSENKTALDLAASNGHYSSAEYLYQSGAAFPTVLPNEQAQKFYLRNPIFKDACEKLQLEEMIRLFICNELHGDSNVFALISINPNLVTKKGKHIDGSKRVFHEISIFQYALWSLNGFLCEQLFDGAKSRPDILTELIAQLNEHYSSHPPLYVTQYGLHFDFSNAILAMKNLIEDKSEEKFHRLLRNKLAKAQEQYPTHIIDYFFYGFKINSYTAGHPAIFNSETKESFPWHPFPKRGHLHPFLKSKYIVPHIVTNSRLESSSGWEINRSKLIAYQCDNERRIKQLREKYLQRPMVQTPTNLDSKKSFETASSFWQKMDAAVSVVNEGEEKQRRLASSRPTL